MTNIKDKCKLAALLDTLDGRTRIFITHRLGPHETEAVAEGNAAELRASRCVEVCGDNIVEQIKTTISEGPSSETPILLVTIGRKAAAE
jgi:hypothetical protein